jgi:exopolysaccharide production protein ExoZ
MASSLAMKEQIRILQVLRACAAGAVVFIHANDRTRDTVGLDWSTGQWLSEHLCNAGVDLFFVISGFLMTRLHAAQFGVRGAGGKFFRKRVQRIAPLYWVLSGLAALLLLAPQLTGIDRQVSWAWLLGNFLFVPWPQPNGTMEHLIIVGWTLDFEMWFYVVFALALTLRRGLLGMTGFLLGCVVIGFFVRPTHPWPALLVSPMLLEFLAGVGVALVAEWRPPRALARTVLTVGLGLLVASTLVDGARYWRDGIPCTLIVLGCLWLAPACQGLMSRLLMALGNASYSTYLFQIFVLPPAAVLLRMAGGARLPAGLDILLLWSAATAAGYLCWRYLEQPLTAWTRPPLLTPLEVSP